jgi:hypothetical protein
MATRKHNLRVVPAQEAEAPKSIKEELDDIETAFLKAISLLEVLNRAVGAGEDHELEASLGIVIGHLHDAHDRLDLAGMRIAREGAPRTIRVRS